ncbi:MAG: glycosyltransferase family 2 protein [Anaerolineae bacterium]|nr:glycosyltransferase family 2 protein [Anaerolineae bacterium]
MIAILFWLSVLLIVYTYLGYPVVLAALASLRPRYRPPAPPTEWPTVTLLITAYNEEAVIAAKLDNSLALHYPSDKLQVLVAADGSDDRTVEIVTSFADRGVELSYRPERAGKLAALKNGVLAARGDIIVFSDANNMYNPDALHHLAQAFGDEKVGAVSGAKHVAGGSGEALGASEGAYWKYESFIKKQETRLGCCTGVAGEILAVRRSLFTPPPTGIINDDFYIAIQVIKQGYHIMYAPEAQSFEPVSLSAKDEITRRSRIIAGRYQVILRAFEVLPFRRPVVTWQIVSHKFLRPLVPFAMILALLANVLAVIFPAAGSGLAGFVWLVPPWNWAFLGLQVAFYGLAALGRVVGKRGALGKLLYLPTFLVDSNFAALKGLMRYASGKQTAIWQRVARG